MAELRRYKAFISYSQTDKATARRLQKWLEAYRAPKNLGGAKLGRVFRDEDDLSGAADLGEALKDSIDGSEALIVLCSPRAARSQWVEREIRHFRATDRGGRIFALILEGEPNSQDPGRECFPPSFRVSDDDTVMPIEPLAVNLVADGRERAFTRLAAGLIDAPFDDLWQRERRRQRARAAGLGGLAAAGFGLLAAAIVGGWFALANIERAERESAAVAEARSRSVIQQSEAIAASIGAHETALLMALYADPEASSPDIPRKLAPAAGYPHARARVDLAYETMGLVKILRGHQDIVTAIGYSPDGRHVVTGSSDRTAQVWDVQTAKSVLTLKGHDAPLWFAVYSPDGRFIATASADKTARIWDAATGKELHKLAGNARDVDAVTFSSDGRLVVTASEDGVARIWDVATGKLVRSLQEDDYLLTHAAFSNDSRFVTTSLRDGTAHIWDLQTGAIVRALQGHKDTVYMAIFSPDDRSIVTGSADNTARIWDASTGEEVHRLEGFKQGVPAVSFSSDGRFVLTGSYDDTAAVWDAETGLLLNKITGHQRDIISAAFSPDGHFVATASDDRTARIWDALPATPIRSQSSGGLLWDAIIRQGAELIVKKLDEKAKTDSDAEPDDLVYSTAFSADRRHVVVLEEQPDDDGIFGVPIFETGTGDVARMLEGHTGRITSAVYSPDGKTVLTGSLDKTARIWDAETGKTLRTLEGHGDVINAVAFSPDGRFVLTASSDTTARIWDAATGKLLRALEGHLAQVMTAVFSPDGRFVITGSADKSARIWDAATGKPLATLEGHADSLSSVALSADGRWALTGSADRTARIWDIGTGKTLSILQGHEDTVTSTAFSPDGRFVVTGAKDKVVRIWAMQPIVLADAKTQVKMACEKLSNARAPLAFAVADVARFPVLQGKPVDPVNPTMFASPCREALPDAAFAPSADAQ